MVVTIKDLETILLADDPLYLDTVERSWNCDHQLSEAVNREINRAPPVASANFDMQVINVDYLAHGTRNL